MTRVLAACTPETDAAFVERVSRVVHQDRWDLGSPEGAALVEAVLRASYPLAAVVGGGGVWSGGVRRTLVLNVYRDGLPASGGLRRRWVEAVFDEVGHAAYGAAAQILGQGREAEVAVEKAFRHLPDLAPSRSTLEAAGSLVIHDVVRRAKRARSATAPAPAGEGREVAADSTELASATIGKNSIRRSLRGSALSCLLSSQREALELSVLEDLKVNAIAERMQTTPAVVHRHLGDAIRAVDAGVRPSAAMTLAHWREAQRRWAAMPSDAPARPTQSAAVAHAWLDYQVARGAVRAGTALVVTDISRRFVTATASAGTILRRPSVIGLHIDDVTADYARPLVPELWTMFGADGSMSGDYDCGVPGQPPVRIPFRGVWARPLPDLQVGYLQNPR